MTRRGRAGVVRLCVWADARRRWRGWLGGALLIGVVAGSLLAVVVGAHQTRTAYARFLDEARAVDVFGGSEGCYDPAASCDLRDLRDLPSVEQVALFGLDGVEGTTADGRALGGGEGDAAQAFVVVPRWNPYDPTRRSTRIGPVLGRSLNRWQIVVGRASNPAAVDEAVVGDAYAEDNGIEVGEDLTLRFYVPNADFSDSRSVNRRFRVVGIARSPGEVRPPNGHYLAVIHTTPAFTLRALEDGLHLNGGAAVRLRPEATIEAFEDEITEENIDLGIAFSQGDHAAGIQRSLDTDAQGLLLVAGLSAVAGLVVLAQAINRTVLLGGEDHPTLIALGASAWTRFALSQARLVPVALGAAVVSFVVAYAVSPALPRGRARSIDPSVRAHLDLGVVGVGSALLVAAVLGVGAVSAWRLVRRPTAAGTAGDRSARVRWWGPMVARRVASVPLAAGVRNALDPGRGRTAVPIRSTIGAIALAVMALTAAVTFRAGAVGLLHEPARYGETWDLAIRPAPGPGGDEDPGPPDAAAVAGVIRVLEDSPDVDSAAVAVLSHSFPDHGLLLGPRRVEVPFLVLDPLIGDLPPAIIEGREPERRDEIALAKTTMTSLDLAIGDEVVVKGQDGTNYEERTLHARVVGQTVIPNISQFGRLGEGAVITRAALEHLDSAWMPGGIAVTLTPDGDATALVDDLTAGTGIDFVADRPVAGLVDDVEQVADLPLIMALLMALAALALLVHALATSARRRAPDLAVLRSLGLLRRQVRTVLGAEAAVVTLLALLIAVPAGLVAGRLAWQAYATSLGVVARPEVPPAVTGLSLVAILLLAALIGRLVGRGPTRHPVAVTLARE